jgi:AraC-like DNA-binding protein
MAQDWSRYWRAADLPLEAMYAHFEQHVYHRHSHDCYSFGVTEDGAQAFRCRGARHTSAAGMVMAFNPDDPHDGHAADELGFTYRIVHIGTELVASVLAEITGGPLESGQASLPLFAEPVLDDVVLARSLGALHRGLLGGASALRRDELLAAAIASMARRASTSGAVGSGPRRAAGGVSAGSVSAGAVSAGAVSAGAVSAGIGAADRARQFIHAAVGADVTAGQLAAAAGCSSRFALHRAFVSAYGMTPADYQRQLRLRAARTLIAAGRPISEAAAASGFADQSHLTRWFARCYGITPGEYRRAGCPVVSQTEVRPTVVRHTGSGNR